MNEVKLTSNIIYVIIKLSYISKNIIIINKNLYDIFQNNKLFKGRLILYSMMLKAAHMSWKFNYQHISGKRPAF